MFGRQAFPGGLVCTAPPRDAGEVRGGRYMHSGEVGSSSHRRLVDQLTSHAQQHTFCPFKRSAGGAELRGTVILSRAEGATSGEE